MRTDTHAPLSHIRSHPHSFTEKNFRSADVYALFRQRERKYVLNTDRNNRTIINVNLIFRVVFCFLNPSKGTIPSLCSMMMTAHGTDGCFVF